MKKVLLIILGIITATVLVGNADFLSNFVSTLQTGATLPLCVACLLMLGRHLVQAASYDAAFEAVGYKTGFWHNVILIFSLVFINTFCLFSGATGVAFIIDDAHRKGADIGTSTSGAILSQIGYFAAIFVISIIGFVTMLISGTMNTLFLLGGLALGGTLLLLSSMFFLGYYKPDALYLIFDSCERAFNWVMRLFKKHLRAAWGSSTADSLIKSARILAHNPIGAFTTVAYAALSAILNMACLVAIGYAFGFDKVAPLIAAFAVAAISVILSPTPQGVGVVEAAIAMILTANGSSFSTATAIALVYRGIMFWIPFCIGAILLSQSGFFKNKKEQTKSQKLKDTGLIAATLVGLVGLVNIGLALFQVWFAPYGMLTQWIDLGGVFVGPSLIAVGLILIVLAGGLVARFRLVWAFAITILVLLAGSEFLFADTIKVAIPIVVLIGYLFVKREAFDRSMNRVSLKNEWTRFRREAHERELKQAEEAAQYDREILKSHRKSKSAARALVAHEERINKLKSKHQEREHINES